MKNSGAITFLITCMIFILIIEIVRMWQVNNLEAGVLDMKKAVAQLKDDQSRGSLEITQVRRRIDGMRETMDSLNQTILSGKIAVEAVASSVVGEIRSELKTGLRTARKYLHPEVKNYLSEDPFVITVPEANTEGKIVRWFGSEPKGLNPLTENGADVSESVYAYVGEGFADRHYENPDLWAPVLAERIEITNDYKEYTVYIKPGIKWHRPAVDLTDPKFAWLKGDHFLTAHDVKFTIDTILNPQVECAFLRNYYEDLESLEIVDEHTVIFRWKKKTYNSLSFTLGLAPIPEFIFAYDEDGTKFSKDTFGFKFNQHWYSKKAIGTGPYEFVAYEPGMYLRLTRNENYHGTKPAIKDIEWLIYSDPDQNLLKLKSGEQDHGGYTPTQYRNEILEASANSPFNTGKMNYKLEFRPTYYYIGWNANRPLFSDRRVRRAMTHAFNKEQILKNVFMGLGEIVTGGFYYNSSSYNHDVKPLAFDLARASALLEEAGWRDTDGNGVLDKIVDGQKNEFEFSFLCYGSSQEWKTAANIFKEDLYKIGVKMNIQSIDWAIMQKRMEEGDFDSYSGGWGLSWESDPFQLFHSSQADMPKSSNRVGFRNKEADRIIEELRETFDPYERQKLSYRFHELLHEEQPYTFFYCAKGVFVWWDYVKRVYFRKVRPVTFSVPWYVDR